MSSDKGEKPKLSGPQSTSPTPPPSPEPTVAKKNRIKSLISNLFFRISWRKQIKSTQKTERQSNTSLESQEWAKQTSMLRSIWGVSRPPRIDSRRRTVISWIFVAVFSVMFIVIILPVLFQITQFEHKSSPAGQDVLLLASYPRLLSTGDQDGAVITVVNNSKKPIMTTTVSLVYNNATHVSMDIDGSSVLQFGHLAPSERKTKLVRFHINRIDSIKQELEIDLNLSAWNDMVGTQPVTNTLQIEHTIISFMPLGMSRRVLDRSFTVPFLVSTLAAIPVSVKFVMEFIKLAREVRGSDSERKTSSS